MGYDDRRTLSDSAWDEYAALSPDDRGQGPVSDRQWLAEADWSAEFPVGLGEQPAGTREAEWVSLRRLAGAHRTGLTAWGWRHKGWTERDIRDAAKHRIVTLWRAGRSLWASSYKARYGVEPTPLMRLDRTAALRGERRNMRRCVRQAEEAAALLAGHVGSRGHQARYASRCSRSHRADQLEQHDRYLSESLVIDTTTGEAIPLAKVHRQPRQLRAELYIVTRGMIAYEIAQDRWPYFITLTLPATWHPAPKFGRAKWDGSLPVAGQRELRRRWALGRARAKKAGIDLVGGRFVEPHSDGCVHWHLIAFLRDDDVQRVIDMLTAVFGDLGPAVRIERARSAEGAAKYCMAYAAKTAACGDGKIGQHITGDDLAGVDAWRSTWGIRGWQLFGTKGRLGVWRELRRKLPEDAPAEIRELARHARAGDYAAFHGAAEENGARIWSEDAEREYPDPDPRRHAAAEAHDQRAVIVVRRRRICGVRLERRGVCVATRQPGRWVLIRAEDSAAASAAALGCIVRKCNRRFRR